MKLQYTPRALADREAIFSDLEARNPRAARKVVGLIVRRAAELGIAPHKGRATDRAGISTLWVAPFLTELLSRPGDAVVILHIRHTSRRSWSG